MESLSKAIDMKKTKAPKCITCGKNLRRKSESFYNKEEPYKGNMICYRVKKTRVGEWDYNGPYETYVDGYGETKDRPTIFIPKVPEQYTYSYTLWDGVSYYYYYGKPHYYPWYYYYNTCPPSYYNVNTHIIIKKPVNKPNRPVVKPTHRPKTNVRTNINRNRTIIKSNKSNKTRVTIKRNKK